MAALATTPPERLVDERGRPYFLWDEDLTLDEFRRRLGDPNPEVRAYYIGKLMRQAKPDEVFQLRLARRNPCRARCSRPIPRPDSRVLALAPRALESGR